MGLNPADEWVRDEDWTPINKVPIPEDAPKFILNEGQQKALDWLIPFCTERNFQFEGKHYRKALLEGWAGTGKTFVTNRVIEAVKLISRGIGVGMTAPTHKAVRNLRKHSELKTELDFGTIHSFLGLKQVQKPDPRNPSQYVISYELEWNSQQERRIDSIQVLVVDEASMLDDDLYGHIEDALRNIPNLRVLFMGDGLQIPPVGNTLKGGRQVNPDAIPFSAAQRSSRGIYYLQLTEIVRQGLDNPIIAYSAAIREQISHQTVLFEATGTEDKGVELILAKNNKAKVMELFAKYFDTPEFAKDPDYVKVISWRNDTVKYFNTEIRLMINKAETLPRIIVGDKLLMDEPLIKGKDILLTKNEEMIVLSVNETEVPVNYKIISVDNAFDRAQADAGEVNTKEKHYTARFKIYSTRIQTDEGKVLVINIIHEDSLEDYNSILEKIRVCALKQPDGTFEKKEMWRQFYKFPEPFARVNYNYCITAHKSLNNTGSCKTYLIDWNPLKTYTLPATVMIAAQ